MSALVFCPDCALGSPGTTLCGCYGGNEVSEVSDEEVPVPPLDDGAGSRKDPAEAIRELTDADVDAAIRAHVSRWPHVIQSMPTADNIPTGWHMVHDDQLGILMESMDDLKALLGGDLRKPLREIVRDMVAVVEGAPASVKGRGIFIDEIAGPSGEGDAA